MKSIGSVAASTQKSQANFAVLSQFVKQTEWIHFLTEKETTRSNTSVCLSVGLTKEQLKGFIKLLADNQVAFDIGAYKDAPSGLRIWCGSAVEASDLEILVPWLELSVSESQLNFVQRNDKNIMIIVSVCFLSMVKMLRYIK